MKNESKKKLKGIGGWLLFFTIIIIIFVILLTTLSIFYIVDLIQGKPIATNPYMLFVQVMLLILWGYALNLEFKYKKEFPKVVIGVLIINWILGLVNSIFESNIFYFLATGFVWTLIWVAYFLKSKRVKNTFVK
ncbi:MAG: DUF2569 family protein [archaeon]